MDDNEESLVYAVKNNDITLLKKLLLSNNDEDKFDINEALFVSVSLASFKLFKALIKSGIDTMITDESGNTPLHHCVNYSLKWVNLLPLHDNRNDYSHTPLLSYLYQNGRVRDIDALKHIITWENVNMTDKNGYTPLDYAIYYNLNPTIVDILIRKGARRGKPVYVFGNFYAPLVI